MPARVRCFHATSQDISGPSVCCTPGFGLALGCEPWRLGAAQSKKAQRTHRKRCSMMEGPSSQGRRHVLVYKLNGGSPITAKLKELRKTGLRAVVSDALQSGEVVTLVLPPSRKNPSASGRTIIGHVVGTGAAREAAWNRVRREPRISAVTCRRRRDDRPRIEVEDEVEVAGSHVVGFTESSGGIKLDRAKTPRGRDVAPRGVGKSSTSGRLTA
jgi:hypothetical protein